jgi:hypothetical protein
LHQRVGIPIHVQPEPLARRFVQVRRGSKHLPSGQPGSSEIVTSEITVSIKHKIMSQM